MIPLPGFLRTLWRRDLSYSYADASITSKQRQVVEPQLKAMRAGKAPEHFKVAAEVMELVLYRSGLRSVSVLDAGCGSAYYSEILDFFQPGAFRYVGADFNPGMLAEAQGHYPGLPLLRTDLRRLSLRDESCDAVMSGAAIVHIREWQSAVREMARVARRWLILHRTLVRTSQQAMSVKIERAYDKTVYRVRINESELLDIVGA